MISQIELLNHNLPRVEKNLEFIGYFSEPLIVSKNEDSQSSVKFLQSSLYCIVA